MRFEFTTSNRIIFGPGSVAGLGSLVASLGNQALIVCGAGIPLPDPLRVGLDQVGVHFSLFRIMGEPDLDHVREGVSLAHQNTCEVVIGFGGGSAVDMAKAIAGVTTNPGDVLDYLEVIGAGRTLTNPALPVIAIPTTAGTGAEVTRNAVITSPEHHYKASLRSPYLVPRIALIDPELHYSLPADVTASTGMDALTQLIESYLSIRANPITDGLCLQGIPLAARSLRVVYTQPNNAAAREEMALASLFSGIALANAGLGAVHGFASPIGGIYGAPHGTICARLLAPACTINLRAVQRGDPDSQVKKRFTQIAYLITGSMNATAEDAVAWMDQLTEDLDIPRLRQWGIKKDDFSDLAQKASQASSMKTNPIKLSEGELIEILELAW